MESEVCVTCGLQRDAKGPNILVCTVCSNIYHRLCRPSSCRCSNATTLVEYPLTHCLMPTCKNPTRNKLFCSACSELLALKIYKLVELYEKSGLTTELFFQKTCALPGLPSWFNHLIRDSFFYKLYRTWIMKTVTTIIYIDGVIYTIEYYILKGMLTSNYTMFDTASITSLPEYLRVKNDLGMSEASLLKIVRIFLRKITSRSNAPLLWLPNGKIRKKTPLNIFDKNSLLQQTIQRSTSGIKIEDVYAEYREAHLHICELLAEDNIWIGGDWDTIFPFTVALKEIPGVREDWLNHNNPKLT